MRTRRTAGLLLLLLLGLPLAAGLVAPPRLSNPPVGADLIDRLQPPPTVAELLRRSCYDCHSHETRWPWYAHLAPAGWFLAEHVEEGRGHLNFSDWDAYTDASARHKLAEAVEEVAAGRMPLRSYRLLHPDARVATTDAALLSRWVAGLDAAEDDEAVDDALLTDLGEAPPLSLPRHDGKGTLSLEELRARGPVLVDFWATWCVPCRKALPEYAVLQERYGDRGFTVLAVSQDAAHATDKVAAFVDAHALPFPVVLDPDRQAGRVFGVRSLPTSFLVDGAGRVRAMELGWRPGHAALLARRIEALLPPGEVEVGD